MTDRVVCRECHRPIRTAASRALGYGRKCAEDLGLTPPRRPRIARPAPARKTTGVAPDQTAIPIQLELTP